MKGVTQTEQDPMSMPPHGTEVFMGGLHRGVTDHQLHAFASEAGEVYAIKLMRDHENPSQNRGYGFVTYRTREGALTAMDRLSGRQMPNFPSQTLRVQPSQAKNRLFVGGLPHALTKDQLRNAIEMPLGLKGLKSADLSMNRESPGLNRGFAFLEFYNAACAQDAKAKMADFRIGDRAITVDVAEPSGQEAAAAHAIKCIFVGNLPAAVQEIHLREAFIRYGEIERINIPQPKPGQEDRRYGFVHFTERLAAARAVEDEQKPDVLGAELIVKYGRTEQTLPGGTGVAGAPGGRGPGVMQPRGGFAGAPGGRGVGGGRGGAGWYDQAPPQQIYPGMAMQPAFGGMGMGGGGMMMGGVGGMGGGMMPMMPVQLPNGQMGYMLQPGAMMGGGGGMGDGGMGPVRGGGRGVDMGQGRGGPGGAGGYPPRGGFSRGGLRGGRTGGTQRYAPY